jgi:hypothetical protein
MTQPELDTSSLVALRRSIALVMLYLKALGAIERLFGRLPRWISRGLDRLSDELCVLEDVFLPRADEAETTSPAQTVKTVRTRKKRAAPACAQSSADENAPNTEILVGRALDRRAEQWAPVSGASAATSTKLRRVSRRTSVWRAKARLTNRPDVRTGGIRGIAVCNAPASSRFILDARRAIQEPRSATCG